MDKNAIKKYAVWARNELIARVTQKAEQYEITEKKTTPKDAASINGRLLTDAEKNQRKALIDKIQEDGFEQVMEEVAYTWFNRFTALRFMEVNNYLPSHTRVFTNEAGEFKPQILADAIQLDLEGLDMDKVFELKEANKTEELYKYLLITQCNALSAVLPRMFQKIEHYTELLLPDYLLREGSVIEQMIALIPEEDWTDQVQIIGWLYQYYITEQNELVYDGTLSKEKVSKELVSAATTIYTPDWPVHYMVENSLGRLWVEGHPKSAFRKELKYYIDDAEQNDSVEKAIENIRNKYSSIHPEDIRCIDPCMGSGHILCVLFDVLIKIYEDYGYTSRDAVSHIVGENLWGIDIDERAAQLSYFTVMMKGRQYDRRFLSKQIQPHLFSIVESNGLSKEAITRIVSDLSQADRNGALEQILQLVDELKDAKEYGSILEISSKDWDLLRRFTKTTVEEGQLKIDLFGEEVTIELINELINIGQALSQKYDIVVTNPPYLGSRRFDSKLDAFVKKNYADVKYDLSMVMYKRALTSLCRKDGLVSFITTSSWMTLASFEKLRQYVIDKASIVNLVDFGTELFEGKVGHNPIVAWVTRNSRLDYVMSAVRLVDYCFSRRDEKEKEFFNKNNYYTAKQNEFDSIPGSPIAYWVSDSVKEAFEQSKLLSEIAQPKQGMVTRDNARFLRSWWEPDYRKIGFDVYSHEEAKVCSYKWFPCTTGGAYRKWYGNNESVVNFAHDGEEIIAFSGSHIKNREFYFRESVTWSAISSSKLSMRYAPKGFLPEHAGNCLYCDDESLCILQALCNSSLGIYLLSILSPTFNYNVGDIANIPVLAFDKDHKRIIVECVHELRECAKKDWDSFETSWDFLKHPLIRKVKRIQDAFDMWTEECDERKSQIKIREEKLNKLFAERYQISDVEIAVKDKDLTVAIPDLKRDIKSFISYAVGCMFGRYSLDYEGIVLAGGEIDYKYYQSYIPDKDNIIPICDDEYFEDDVVNRFVLFVKTVYGSEHLEDNLEYIANTLGGSGNSRERIRNYFLNDFYKDHLKTYQKKPIYWQVDSGAGGFKCLVYIHRYKRDTIARIRTDYVHELQSRYRTAIESSEKAASSASGAEKIAATKNLSRVRDQSIALGKFEEKVHHLADQMIEMDLDSGVKNNYSLIESILTSLR